jgi:hypothetical protein
MLPDFLVPFKHYEEPVITDTVNEEVIPAESDDRPSAITVVRWKHWLMANAANIDGLLKSIGHRELGYSTELLESSVSLLKELRSSIPKGWLKEILRVIYNAGEKLSPCYS